MARVDDHIAQAKRNLVFLSSINNSVRDCYDWRVTVCFYTALHFVNAYLATFGQQYRKHSDVNFAINYNNLTSPAKLPEDEYLSYMALQSLSRRSRYLVNDKDGNISNDQAFFTYDKHLIRSLRHLDKLTKYFTNIFRIKIEALPISCIELKEGELVHFFKK